MSGVNWLYATTWKYGRAAIGDIEADLARASSFSRVWVKSIAVLAPGRDASAEMGHDGARWGAMASVAETHESGLLATKGSLERLRATGTTGTTGYPRCQPSAFT